MEITTTIEVPEDLKFVFKLNESRDYSQEHLDLSRMWLRGIQNYINHALAVRGHVFLNEVLDSLGLPRTSEGAILGWTEGNVALELSDQEYYISDVEVTIKVQGEIVSKI